jgi:putative transposase
MLRAYKYRIYPTNEQEKMLAQQFGIGRFVYNWVLSQKQKEYERQKACKENIVGEKPKEKSAYDYCKLLTESKKEHAWICKAHSQAIQQEIAHCFLAYTRFFKNLKARKTQGKKFTKKNERLLDFPCFKSKKDRQSLSFSQETKVNFQSETVQIPKLGKVKCIFSRKFVGQIKTTTLSKTVTNKYFVSILVEDGVELPELVAPDQDKALGIDVGLTHFATLSDGTKIANPRLLRRSLSRLKRAQRSMGRKKNRASKNYGKAKLRRALLEERVANQRSDFLHKATHNLVCKSQATTFCVEDLSVKNLMQNHKLARSIADVSWSEFFRQLKYKAQWHGKNVVEIGRFVPSSKTCSHCGYKVDSLPLSIRRWQCSCCGVEHDRDLNAARNMVIFAFDKVSSVVAKIPAGQPRLDACGCVASVNGFAKDKSCSGSRNSPV